MQSISNTQAAGRDCPYCGVPYHKLIVKLFGKEQEVWSKSCSCGDSKQKTFAIECRFCGSIAEGTRASETSPVVYVECKSCGEYYGESHPEIVESVAAKRIPLRFQNADMSWMPEVAEWIASPTIGLLISGNPGTGKTWSACGALKAWNGDSMFCRASEIIDDAHDAFASGEKAEALARYVRPSLLLVDDLGKENPTDFAVELIFRVINERGEANKPTIVTTNYEAGELFNRLCSRSKDEVNAAAIMSRLHEYTQVKSQGRDRRLV